MPPCHPQGPADREASLQECLEGCSVVETGAATATKTRVGLHTDGGRQVGRLFAGIAEGVIQGLRQPGSKPMQVGSAGGGVGKGSIHGPYRGRHFSIVPADAIANRYLHRLSLARPRIGRPRQGVTGLPQAVPTALALVGDADRTWDGRSAPPGERLPLKICWGRGGRDKSRSERQPASRRGSSPTALNPSGPTP